MIEKREKLYGRSQKKKIGNKFQKGGGDLYLSLILGELKKLEGGKGYGI